jgi:hypothetical protein
VTSDDEEMKKMNNTRKEKTKATMNETFRISSLLARIWAKIPQLGKVFMLVLVLPGGWIGPNHQTQSGSKYISDTRVSAQHSFLAVF